MVFEVGNEIVTRRPGVDGNFHVEEVQEVEGENERTPRQQNVKKSKADTSDGEGPVGPYETPVVLRTKPWTPSVVQDDTEADDSEIERMAIILKRKRAARLSSGDNLNADD
jgi:hypothetical protein